MSNEEPVVKNVPALTPEQLKTVPSGLRQLLISIGFSPEIIAYILGKQDAIDWRLVIFTIVLGLGLGVGFTFMYFQWYIMFTYEIPKLMGGMIWFLR